MSLFAKSHSRLLTSEAKFFLSVGIAVIATIGFGIVMIATSIDPLVVRESAQKLLEPTKLFAALLSLLSILVATFAFSRINRDVRTVDDGASLIAIKARLAALENSQQLATLQTPEAQKEIVDELAERIRSQAIEDRVAEHLKKMSGAYEKVWQIQQFEHIMKGTKDRLLQQVSALGSRANLNLLIGLALAITGVVILIIFVATSLERDKGFERFIVDFLPRISLVLLIEVFSYFFLRLYKQGIDEIRYFQNEVTNGEMKLMAILVAQRFSPEKVSGIITSLVNTERNFLVPKDQRLVAEAVEAQVETAMQKYLNMVRDFAPKAGSDTARPASTPNADAR